MENIINDIKKSVDHSIELSFGTLLELKQNLYKNNWTYEFAKTVREAKIELIDVSAQYAISKFKSLKIEKSPSPLYHWIVDEVNTRFDIFIESQSSKEKIQSNLLFSHE